jgi:hypothetical protein
MDIIGASRNVFMNAATIAMGAVSDSRPTRLLTMGAVQRGFMNHMARPMMIGAAAGAGTFMAGSILGGAMNGNLPTPGQFLGAGLRGGILGGMGGGLYGMRRMGGPMSGALSRSSRRMYRQGGGYTRFVGAAGMRGLI